MGDTSQLQLRFFTGLVDAMRGRNLPFTTPTPHARHWVDLTLGTSRAHIALCALGDGHLRCELYSDHAQADAIYENLAAERTAIETELRLTDKLDWQPLPNAKSIRIAVHKDIVRLDKRERWPEAYAWMIDWAVRFNDVFGQRVKDMALPGQT